MACRAAPRLSCCWSSVAARPRPLESSVGSVVGCACGAFAIRPSPRAAAWSDRSSSFRRASLERLVASDIRPNSLCCCCRVGWVAAPALHHAKNRESADLGFNSYSDCARVCHPILGRAAGAAAARGAIRVSQLPKRLALLTPSTAPVPQDKPVNLAEAVAASLGAPELLSLPAQVPCLAADLCRSPPAQDGSRPIYRSALPGFQLSPCCIVHYTRI